MMVSASDILNARILIVDDQETNVRLLQRILTSAGYAAVASTTNPYEVCELHRQNRFNLILLDLQMPGMDGFQVMEILNEIEPEGYLPVLAITAQPAHKLRALKAGAKDFITKPFDQAEVLMRIRNMLEVRLWQIEAKSYSEFLEQMVDERTETLRESEELFRQLATNIPQALWLGDSADGTIRYVNPCWERLSGRRLAPGEPMDRIYESVYPDDVQRVLGEIRRHPEHGTDLEYRMVRPDNSVRWVHARTFAIYDADGEPYRVAGIIDDITDRREESQRIERLKDEFVATVSHELRTPLTSISGSLALLMGGSFGKLPETAGRLVAIAQSNSQRLVRLLNDILDIEKIESGKLPFNMEPLSIHPLIEQAIEGIRGFAQGYGIQIRLEAGADLAQVHADSLRLVQVVTNLLSNAIKFSPPGGEVVVTIESGGEFVCVSVRDHGPGIPDDFKPRVFEKFAQADASDARQKGGTGLGLSIVKEIVTRLNGEVSFEDAPGGGTIFRLAFPSLQASAAPEASAQIIPGELPFRSDQLRRSGSQGIPGANAAR